MLEIVNDLMLNMVGKDESIIGKPCSTAMPSVEGHSFDAMLDKVLATGEKFHVNDTNYKFIYQPIKNTQGDVYRIICVAFDISEQRRDEQRKNDFISMVSHELKTPLTSVNSYIQLVQRKAEAAGDRLVSGMLEKAGCQVSKMTTLINGFLNVSRLESSKIHIDRRCFDLTSFFREIEEETIVQVSSHRVIFSPVEAAMVDADRDKLGQVINNLISNAAKYSTQHSTINVACVIKDSKALISVKDEGMGISKEDLPRLFERYYRARNSATQYISGFGIGLYLCYEIVKRHDGEIWAESEVGKGSTFYFTIPLSENCG